MAVSSQPFSYNSLQFWDNILSHRGRKYFVKCGDATFPLKEKELVMRLQSWRPALIEGYITAGRRVVLSRIILPVSEQE
jgi:hypothetical protein